MKGSFTILCFALIFGILAGCTGTSTVTTLPDTIDPFVGSWKNTASSGTTFIYRFTQSGQYFCTRQNDEEQLWGNWIKIGDNTYHAILWANKSTTNRDSAVPLTYDQNTDTLSDIKGNRLYRLTTLTPSQELPRFPKPKYMVGDVISKEMPYYYEGFVISGYNEKTGNYSRVKVGRANCGNGKYGVWGDYGGGNWDDMDASTMESTYPIYLGRYSAPSTC